MQCSNNLKQFGIGIHNYLSATSSFPAARSFLGQGIGQWTSGRGGPWSVATILMPYMENDARYQELVSATNNASYRLENPWTDTADGLGGNAVFFPALAGPVPSFICPSDPNGKLPSTDIHMLGRLNYATCRGDGLWNNQRSPLDESTAAAQVGNRGVFQINNWAGTESCVDGTSNTLMFAETVSGTGPRTGSSTTGIRSPLVGNFITLSTMYTGTNSSPETCMNEVLDSKTYRRDIATSSWRGQRFGDGRVMHNGFTCNVPPNGPSCSHSGDDNWGAAAASSMHSGGVNVCLADGSTKFISQTIDCNGSSALTVTAGKSPFGIWGGLGTRDGGETVTPP